MRRWSCCQAMHSCRKFFSCRAAIRRLKRGPGTCIPLRKPASYQELKKYGKQASSNLFYALCAIANLTGQSLNISCCLQLQLLKVPQCQALRICLRQQERMKANYICLFPGKVRVASTNANNALHRTGPSQRPASVSKTS